MLDALLHVIHPQNAVCISETVATAPFYSIHLSILCGSNLMFSILVDVCVWRARAGKSLNVTPPYKWIVFSMLKC